MLLVKVSVLRPASTEGFPRAVTSGDCSLNSVKLQGFVNGKVKIVPKATEPEVLKQLKCQNKV